MGTIYIGIIMLCRVAQAFCNKFASNNVNGTGCFLKYTAYRNLLSGMLGLILILIAGTGFKFNASTVFISLLSGVSLACSTILGIVALRNGTMALTSIFGTAGLLIPVIAGVFLFDTPISIGQCLGIILFFVAAFLLISSSRKIYTGFSFKTLLLLIGVLLAEGSTMLAQQMFAFYVPDGDVSVFSLFSFGIPGICLLLYVLVNTKKYSADSNAKLTPKLLGLGAILSVAVFIINQLATLAASILSPAVLFTFINGGGTIISTIVAALVFKEKITLKSALGVILGIAALLIIKCF